MEGNKDKMENVAREAAVVATQQVEEPPVGSTDVEVSKKNAVNVIGSWRARVMTRIEDPAIEGLDNYSCGEWSAWENTSVVVKRILVREANHEDEDVNVDKEDRERSEPSTSTSGKSVSSQEPALTARELIAANYRRVFAELRAQRALELRAPPKAVEEPRPRTVRFNSLVDCDVGSTETLHPSERVYRRTCPKLTPDDFEQHFFKRVRRIALRVVTFGLLGRRTSYKMFRGRRQNAVDPILKPFEIFETADGASPCEYGNYREDALTNDAKTEVQPGKKTGPIKKAPKGGPGAAGDARRD